MDIQEIIKRLKAYKHKDIEHETGITTQCLRNVIKNEKCTRAVHISLKNYFEKVEGKHE